MAKKKIEGQKLIKYNIKTIQTNYFNFSMPKVAFDPKNYNSLYNINPTFKYNLKENLIIIHIQVKGFLKETNEMLLDTQTAFVYNVENLKDHLEETPEKKFKFKDPKDEGLLVTLIGISVSTTRGIVLEKLRGSVLDGRVIPVVNPSLFLAKNQK